MEQFYLDGDIKAYYYFSLLDAFPSALNVKGDTIQYNTVQLSVKENNGKLSRKIL